MNMTWVASPFWATRKLKHMHMSYGSTFLWFWWTCLNGRCAAGEYKTGGCFIPSSCISYSLSAFRTVTPSEFLFINVAHFRGQYVDLWQHHEHRRSAEWPRPSPNSRIWVNDRPGSAEKEDCWTRGKVRGSQVGAYNEGKVVGTPSFLARLYSSSNRQTNYYLAQGRGLRHVVTLFDSIEDLVAENDQRYDDDGDDTNGTVK